MFAALQLQLYIIQIQLS